MDEKSMDARGLEAAAIPRLAEILGEFRYIWSGPLSILAC